MSHRRSIHIDGFSHVNPIPAASRIGPLLMSGVITGRDPATGQLPKSLQEQCAFMFGHVRAVVEAAGGSTDNIIKLTIWLANPGDRETLNTEWVRMFPDAESRPARHTGPLTGASADTLVQCDVTAVFPE
jgi:2-iminobutanoate/2-iminopropanoate deaminase